MLTFFSYFVSLCWDLCIWKQGFSWEFLSHLVFHFKCSSWSGRVCNRELMSCSSTLAWICGSVANTHPLAQCLGEYAQHHRDARKLAVVFSVQVAVACLVRSGQVKVSCPLLCCWHFKTYFSVWTRTNSRCKEVCSLRTRQDLIDLCAPQVPSLEMVTERFV
jgi:hypothetical protein